MSTTPQARQGARRGNGRASARARGARHRPRSSLTGQEISSGQASAVTGAAIAIANAVAGVQLATALLSLRLGPAPRNDQTVTLQVPAHLAPLVVVTLDALAAAQQLTPAPSHAGQTRQADARQHYGRRQRRKVQRSKHPTTEKPAAGAQPAPASPPPAARPENNPAAAQPAPASPPPAARPENNPAAAQPVPASPASGCLVPLAGPRRPSARRAQEPHARSTFERTPRDAATYGFTLKLNVNPDERDDPSSDASSDDPTLPHLEEGNAFVEEDSAPE
jgi:hypothetical protein